MHLGTAFTVLLLFSVAFIKAILCCTISMTNDIGVGKIAYCKTMIFFSSNVLLNSWCSPVTTALAGIECSRPWWFTSLVVVFVVAAAVLLCCYCYC